MRMLMIDDEEDICEIVAELGERRGFEVKTVSSTEGITEVLLGFKPDLIMLDLMMPGTDGVELLRLLAEHVRSAKLCLISGSDSRVLNSAKRLGGAHGLDVIAALEKPLNMVALGGLFDKFMEGGTTQPQKTDFTKAITAGQFTVYYQPVVDMKTRQVKGVEALARWGHPSRGVLAPDVFLDQINSEGLMQALTEVVVDTSIQQAAEWRKAGEDFSLSINVTASTLLDLALPDRIVEICKKFDVPPGKLILEVTETEAMRDVTRTMDVLLRMRIRNIGVSIDDFGTGHSSLRELQRMPFSEMKIDKSFVMDMVENKDCAVIVNSIIDLAHNLGLKIIAEGVENVDVWKRLADKGCDYVQGYLVGRPMPATELAAWLKNWRAQAPF